MLDKLNNAHPGTQEEFTRFYTKLLTASKGQLIAASRLLPGSAPAAELENIIEERIVTVSELASDAVQSARSCRRGLLVEIKELFEYTNGPLIGQFDFFEEVDEFESSLLAFTAATSALDAKLKAYRRDRQGSSSNSSSGNAGLGQAQVDETTTFSVAASSVSGMSEPLAHRAGPGNKKHGNDGSLF